MSASPPSITFTGMCQYLSAPTATGRKGIIKKFKYPADGPMKSYVAAEQGIISFLVDGTPIDVTHDQAHVVEVLEAFPSCGWPDSDLTFTRPNARQEKLVVSGVEISLKPSVLVRDAMGRVGACKLFFNKAPSEERPQLRPEVARMMAALLHFYGAEHLDDSAYKGGLCQVVCVRDGDVYASTGRYKKLLDDVEAACEEISLIWPAA